MDRLKGFITKLLPFTPKGWAFLLLSAGLLTLGVLRSELAVLLWGAAFAVLSVYGCGATALTRVALVRRLQRQRVGASAPATLEPLRVRRNGRAAVRVIASLPRRRLPGMRLYARVRLEWNGRRRRAEAFIPPGAMEVRIPLDTSHRGAWEPVEVAVEARDLPGFCVAAVALPCPGILRVLPEAREIPVSAIAAGSGGEGRLHAPLRRRSEELFETRRYVPGDDPRRINWKLFARWNELLVRIGEEVPPPQSKVLCYLYTGPASPRGATGGSAGGRGARDAALDRAVSTFAGVCRVLARRGVDVIYGYGGVEQRGSLGRTGEREFLGELAGVDWDAGARPERAAENTVPARVPALVVAPQETAGVEDLVSELRRRHTGVETYFVPADDANAATPPPLWERLLFRPQPGRPQHGGDRAARAGTGILHRSAGGAR